MWIVFTNGTRGYFVRVGRPRASRGYRDSLRKSAAHKNLRGLCPFAAILWVSTEVGFPVGKDRVR